MIKIGLLSDTHSYLDKRVFEYFKDCDELWHAGDIGDPEVLHQLEKFKPVKAVYGNIDNQTIRSSCPEKRIFSVEGLKVYMIHIGGTAPNYAKGVKADLLLHQPGLFICGHSHILKVKSDPNLNNMLYMNPGAAGKHGFHHVKTMLRFDIESSEPKNLEVIELGKRGA